MLCAHDMCFPILSTGPGPGRYILPPAIGFVGHDFTKSTSPAFSFHGRMSNNSEFVMTQPVISTENNANGTIFL